MGRGAALARSAAQSCNVDAVAKDSSRCVPVEKASCRTDVGEKTDARMEARALGTPSGRKTKTKTPFAVFHAIAAHRHTLDSP